jgi:hypothetical protein
MCPDSDPYCGDQPEPEPETSWWFGLMDLLFDVNNDGDGGFWNWGAFGFFSNDEVSDEEDAGFWEAMFDNYFDDSNDTLSDDSYNDDYVCMTDIELIS